MQPHYSLPPFLSHQKPAVLQIVHIKTLGKHRRTGRIPKNVNPGFQVRIPIGKIRPEPYPRKMHPRSLIKRSSQRIGPGIPSGSVAAPSASVHPVGSFSGRIDVDGYNENVSLDKAPAKLVHPPAALRQRDIRVLRNHHLRRNPGVSAP